MTTDEAATILSILKAAYPESFKKITKKDAVVMIDLWQRMFSDDPYREVSAAVASLIATRKVGYTPTVGEVKEKLQSLRRHTELSEQEAWALVSKACKNGLYGYKQEFDKLPQEVQDAVGTPEQLRSWAMMEVETVESVVSSNFMRTYRAKAAKAKETAMLPGEIRSMICNIADGMKMIGD